MSPPTATEADDPLPENWPVSLHGLPAETRSPHGSWNVEKAYVLRTINALSDQIQMLETRIREQEKRMYILVGLAAGGGAGAATVMGKLFGL